jgi:hypothetical protein
MEEYGLERPPGDGESASMRRLLEQQKTDHEPGLDLRAVLVALERRDLAVDPFPIDLACEPHQLVLHVDDLLEPRSEQIG